MLLLPIIDYCCLVSCDLSKELDVKLQKLDNCGIRYIDMSWAGLPLRREENTLQQIYYAEHLTLQYHPTYWRTLIFVLLLTLSGVKWYP